MHSFPQFDKYTACYKLLSAAFQDSVLPSPRPGARDRVGLASSFPLRSVRIAGFWWCCAQPIKNVLRLKTCGSVETSAAVGPSGKYSLTWKPSPKNFHVELLNTSVSIQGVCKIRNICLCVCFSILNNVFIVSESWTRTVWTSARATLPELCLEC